MNFDELSAAIDAAVSAYHAAPSYEASEAVQSARAALSAAIAEGAKPCECGNAPAGIRQPAAVKHRVFHMFEIGCLLCSGKRVVAPSREAAVAAWNAARDGAQ